MTTYNNKAVTEYILNAVNSDGYDSDPQTNEEKIDFLKETFISEYGWHIEQVGPSKALESWLRGLPSSIGIDFMNCAILELAKKWGSLPEKPSEKEEDKILLNYWPFMACQINKLFNRRANGWKVFPKVKMYIVQGSYGQGWEDVSPCCTFKEGKESLKEYNENECMYAHRLITRMEQS